MAAYTRCLRCAGAPRRPASGSGLSLLIPSWHAVLSDPGEFDIDIQIFDAGIGLFASDCPFDPEGGTMYPRETLQILEKLNLPKAEADKIYFKNLEAVTGRKLVKS
jgi:hypothetical protein